MLLVSFCIASGSAHSSISAAAAPRKVQSASLASMHACAGAFELKSRVHQHTVACHVTDLPIGCGLHDREPSRALTCLEKNLLLPSDAAPM